MKELSIEEKAKRFDEALAMAKECITYIPDDAVNKYMLNIFPELKGSDDEEGRKAMIDFFKHEREEGVTVLHYGVDIERMIAWLENQAEQKSIWHNEDEEPKRGSLILLIMQSGTPIVAKIIEPKHTFNHGERWAYIDDLLEKQSEQKPVSKLKPKFRIGDVIEVKPMKCQDKIFTGKNNKIIDITEESYILDDGKAYSIELQNGWKLSEQKSDEVEPKFKPGDWISGYYTNYKVLSLNNDGYVVEDVDGDKINILFENEKFHHLFTIADAKDGDVLCYKDEISLYKHNIKNCTKQEPTFGGFVYHCCYDGKRFITDSLYSLTEKDKKDIYPATKEQRDTLEKAMTDAGYIFDFESKELKKLGQSEVTKTSDQEEIAEIPFGAKDSELQEAIYYVPKGFHAEIDDDKVVIRKDEKPTAWTEEDNMMIEETLYFLREYQHSNRCKDESDMQNSVTCREWLKSLKEGVVCEANCTTTKEWNESDKEEFQIAIDTLVEAGQHDSAHWLKSLKQRIGG